MNIKQLSSQALFELLQDKKEDIFLLDVREENEVAICALDGATHIPMNLIPLYLDRIPEHPKIVIYCHHGMRSLNVAYYLVNEGFDESSIYNLQGGIDDWALKIDQSLARY